MEYRDLDHLSGRAAEKRDEVRFCLSCDYDLSGSPSDRCPECGELFLASEWRKFADRVRALQADLADGLKLMPAATKLVIAAFAMRFLEFVPVIRESFLPILRPATLGVGWFALFIGLNLLHIRRLPEWSRKQFLERPEPMNGITCVFGGTLLVVSGVLMF